MTSETDTLIKTLADIEAIKRLKHRYATYCDSDYNPDALAGLFVENGVWDGGDFGRYEGREAIHEYFTNMPSVVAWACHYMVNPVIDVDGDTATGDWLLWQPLVLKENDQALWLSGEYHDTYIRVDGQWLYQTLRLETQVFSPYEEGFGKVRKLPSPL